MLELQRIIGKYQQAILQLLPKVMPYLGVNFPKSNYQWAISPLFVNEPLPEGLSFRKHGYGLEIRKDSLVVDFDFGPNGEIDGIDPWKLGQFVKHNNIETPLNMDNIYKIFEEAEKAGTVMRTCNKFYTLV